MFERMRNSGLGIIEQDEVGNGQGFIKWEFLVWFIEVGFYLGCNKIIRFKRILFDVLKRFDFVL